MGVGLVMTASTLAQTPGLFVHPGLALAGAAAVALPIAIHLLARARRRTQPWAAMRFLAQAMQRQRTRLRLRNWLLLLTRCLLVLLLGLALAQPLTGAWTAWGGRGMPRDVAVLLDDSLASRAAWRDAPDEQTRFDRTVRLAREVLETLDERDRVQLLPVSEAIAARPQWRTPAEAMRMLHALPPTYGPTQPQAACDAAVRALMQQLSADADAAADRVLVVASHQPPAMLEALSRSDAPPAGRAPQLLISRPAPSADNVRIAALRPTRRRVYAAAAGDAALGVEVEVRRYGDAGASLPVDVALTLLGGDGQQASAAAGAITLAPGQTQASLGLMLDASSLPRERGTPWVLEATWRARADQAANALADDDAQRRWLQPAGTLRVGLIDRDQAMPQAGELRAGQWWRLALRPRGDDEGADDAHIEPRTLDPQVLTPAGGNADRLLDDFDAVIVLRPDLLSEAAAAALARWARRGGVLWMQPSSDDGRDEAAGMSLPLSALGLADRVGSVMQAMSAEGWPLGVEAPPAALQLLAAEWDRLLPPIRVHRALSWRHGPEEVDDDETDDPARAATVWLSLSGGGGQTLPWLIHVPLGDGHVLLLLSAVDAAWTNLPTRPLFVPLVHESLRALAGSVPLDEAWREVLADAQPPGIHWPDRVLVNVAAEAGDTTTVAAEMLTQTLDKLTAEGRIAGWAWLAEDDAGSALTAAAMPTGRDLGRPLLGAALLLAVGELLLARWMSHGPLRHDADRAQGAEGRP